MNGLKKTRLWRIFATAAGFVLGWVVVSLLSGCLSGNDEKLLKDLRALSGEVNKGCPMQLDAYTTLSTTVILPPRTLRYVYSLDLPEDEEVAEIRSKLMPVVMQQVRTNPDMQQLRDWEVVFSYQYKAPDGTHLFDFEVTPEDYK